MKIIRNGQEFELTSSELTQAHVEFELDCMIEDVKEKYENGEYNVELTEEQIKEIASFALHNLNKNDDYFEAYWMSVKYALDNYIEDCAIKNEE